MKKLFLSLLFALVVCLGYAMTVSNLRMNAYENPIGIDQVTPKFSWVIESPDRGVVQKSYHIVVSDTRDLTHEVWNSGTVASDQSVDVEAKGFVLQPRTRYYWKVTVADNKGNVSTSDELAYFETGLMNGNAWNSAKWINATYDLPGAPKENRKTIKDYELELKFEVKSVAAGVIFAAKDHTTYCMWQVNIRSGKPQFRPHRWTGGWSTCYEDKDIKLSDNKQHTMRIVVRDAKEATTYIDGIEVDKREGDFAYGDFGFRQEYDAPGAEAAYYDDFKVTSNGKVLMADNFDGKDEVFDNTLVKNGRLYVEGPSKYLWQKKSNVQQELPIFRKEFTLKKNIKKARLYSTALGVYNAYVNGKRVGHVDDNGVLVQDELKPGATDYNKTVFYTTHDITRYLNAGKNAIGVEVTNGWWTGGIAHGKFGSKPLAFCGLIIVTYTDGSEEIIASDETWRSNHNGPIRYGDIYNGEVYDARLSRDWSKPNFDESQWFATAETDDFEGEIRAFEGPIVRTIPGFVRLPQQITVYNGVKPNGTTFGEINTVFSSTNPNEVIALHKGETVVYDLGQNAAGWVSFTVKGNAGTELRFRFAEMPNTSGDRKRGDDGPCGSVYTENLRAAEAKLKYILKGESDGESFQPSSTFYGFRYVEVTATDDVTLCNLKGETLTSEMLERSSFETSNALVNKLYSNIMWGQRSNLLSIPTDCPQRDERLGWTADTQIYSMAGLYNADARTFYKKWMRDMRDSQNADGAFPHVAPYAWDVGFGAAAWADAGVILPWNVYVMTGDTEILTDNWEAMLKYMAFLETRKGDGYLYNGGETTYGDWVSFAITDSRYVSVCYYAYVAQLMAKISHVLSSVPGDEYSVKEKEYQTLFENIKAEWQRRYTEKGKMKITTQCAYLMALKYNLLPENMIEDVKVALEKEIKANGNRLSTGFLGTAIINQTLTECGLNDMAYTLLLQRDCPSWLYSVDQGATTIWERWNSYTIKDGYGPVGMNSFNHYAYGIVGEWMFRHMAGICPDEETPGFKNFFLSPNLDARTEMPADQQRITKVSANHWSPYGSVKAEWESGDGKHLTYKVTVPANTQATVALPVLKGSQVLEGGKKVSKVKDIKFVTSKDGNNYYLLGSGEYCFEIK